MIDIPGMGLLKIRVQLPARRAYSPEGGPGFDFTPEGCCFPLSTEWNNGMVEQWNVGDEKRMWSNFIFGSMPIL